MGLRLMATYRGVPYQAGLGPDGGAATLFSPGPPPEELGFTAAAGHWRKQVSVTDLDALWQARPVGDYRGEPCLVLDDLGDRLHIAYLGRDAARAAQLGYWEIDREVFEVVVARGDVTGLTEERVDFALTEAVFGVSGPSAPEAEPAGYAEPTGYAEATGRAEAAGYAEAAGFAEAAVRRACRIRRAGGICCGEWESGATRKSRTRRISRRGGKWRADRKWPAGGIWQYRLRVPDAGPDDGLARVARALARTADPIRGPGRRPGRRRGRRRCRFPAAAAARSPAGAVA